jgi:2-polyprenyl-3-methyl-5-hydroxy-6-metoxy-1,4-benzoquinol methylase
MQNADVVDTYHYPTESRLGHHHDYLLPMVHRILDAEVSRGTAKRIFDLGCGDGSVAAVLAARGFDVTGVDPSPTGIEAARRALPGLRFEQGSAYDDLAGKYGRFPIVLSLEVVEHLYDPRQYARTVYSLLEPGGLAIISTPYHGYFKNLAIAMTGKWDAHHSVLWDHGHIKFWSMPTLTALLKEAGFGSIAFRRVGRIPLLAKSMIALARKD